MMLSRSKRITVCAMLIAVGIILGYLESVIVIPLNVPGVRIGLANTATIVALYLFGPLYALAVLIIRVLLSAALFGSFTAFAYSMAGAVVSFIGMLILKHYDFSVYSVSVSGAVLHNAAQTAVAAWFVGSSYVFMYLPALSMFAVAAGMFTGFISAVLIRRLGKMTP